MANFNLIIVDDDPNFLFIHDVLAKKSDFHQTPLKFEDGYDAIRFLEENMDKNHLLFLDIYMKTIDGWGVLDFIENKNIPEKIKVILISSSVNVADKNKAMEYSSVIDYIEKPLPVEYLNMLKEQVIF